MSKIRINLDDLQDFAGQLGKAAHICDQALRHINVDLYSLLVNIPGVASRNIQELENVFESNLKKYKKNLDKAQHLMKVTEAIMSENERKLARKAREIVHENVRNYTTLQRMDKNVLAHGINVWDDLNSSAKLTDEQIEALRTYIRVLKNGEIDSNVDDYKVMPEDNTWEGNIFPYNPGGEKPEFDHVTKAFGRFIFDFFAGDVVTILDPKESTEDKLIAAAMMLPPAKALKLINKLKELEKMKDAIDHLGDASDKVKDSSDKMRDVSKGDPKSVDNVLETNPFDDLGNLKPNTEYITGEFDYVYKTDSAGRVSEFETDNLQLTERENRLQHNPNTPGKLEGDHAGHLAGDRFGGSPNIDNLVSQSSNVNLSQYKKIENQWAKSIEKGKIVTVNVEVKYEGDSIRPSEFNVEYTIDGEYFEQNIIN